MGELICVRNDGDVEQTKSKDVLTSKQIAYFALGDVNTDAKNSTPDWKWLLARGWFFLQTLHLK